MGENQLNYKEKIIEMISKIKDTAILELIYYYTKSGYNEEKAGKYPRN